MRPRKQLVNQPLARIAETHARYWVENESGSRHSVALGEYLMDSFYVMEDAPHWPVYKILEEGLKCPQ